LPKLLVIALSVNHGREAGTIPAVEMIASPSLQRFAGFTLFVVQQANRIEIAVGLLTEKTASPVEAGGQFGASAVALALVLGA
jgi:hypothetical protein